VIYQIAFRIAALSPADKLPINKWVLEYLSGKLGKTVDDVAVMTMEDQDLHSAIGLLAESLLRYTRV
jgi:hypothetical protein